MKGISLPVNAVIIVSLSILVFVALSAYYLTSFGESRNVIDKQYAWQKGCAKIQSKGKGCDRTSEIHNDFCKDVEGYNGNLYKVCEDLFGYDPDTEKKGCIQQCCPEYDGTPGTC